MPAMVGEEFLNCPDQLDVEDSEGSLHALVHSLHALKGMQGQ